MSYYDSLSLVESFSEGVLVRNVEKILRRKPNVLRKPGGQDHWALSEVVDFLAVMLGSSAPLGLNMKLWLYYTPLQ